MVGSASASVDDASGDLQLLRRLVGLGADVNTQDYDLRTPLHVVALDGNCEAVKLLVAHGVDVDLKVCTKKSTQATDK